MFYALDDQEGFETLGERAFQLLCVSIRYDKMHTPVPSEKPKLNTRITNHFVQSREVGAGAQYYIPRMI